MTGLSAVISSSGETTDESSRDSDDSSDSEYTFSDDLLVPEEEKEDKCGRSVVERNDLYVPDQEKSLNSPCLDPAEVKKHCSPPRHNSCATVSTELTDELSDTRDAGGLSGAVTKKLFPYHVVLNHNFIIMHVGKDLPRVLHTPEDCIIGKRIDQVLKVTRPICGEWSLDWLRKLENQSFNVEPVLSVALQSGFRFTATTVHISDKPFEAMLNMCPDANNLDELRGMQLTLSDLPLHGDHREAVLLREHLSTQMNNAKQIEKLSKSLAKEKAVLESLLPEHAAEGLRNGKPVEPMLHKEVTMFFSDVVGFTDKCKQMYPWQVIGMLNRLYCVMDFLANKFNLFKIETIGDA